MANKKNNKKTKPIKKVSVKKEIEELKEEEREFKEKIKIIDDFEENPNNKKVLCVTFGLLALVVIIVIIIVSIKNKSNLNYTVTKKFNKEIYTIDDTPYVESEEATDMVKIDIKNYGIIIAELYPDIAPITVKNFKDLVSEKFYDGIIFHRVIKDFMIQTGDPNGNGTGGSENKIKGEFSNNGVDNDLSHKRGVLSMARHGGNPDTEETMNSASSQFFIVHKDHEDLDGNYAGFGHVINGIELVDAIASVETDTYDKPLKNITINSIRFVEVYEGESN